MATEKTTIDSNLVMLFLTSFLVSGKVFWGWNISWLWALSPLWIPYAVILAFMVCAFAVGGLVLFAVGIAYMLDKK